MFRTIAGLILLFCVSLTGARADDNYRLLKLDGHVVKWGDLQFGTGVTLTYAIAGRSGSFEGVRNCQRTTDISPLLKSSKLSRQTFADALHKAFDAWEAAANVHFRPARDTASADIVIGAESAPEGIAFADVTSVPSEIGPMDRLARGIVCLNPELMWTSRVCPSTPARTPLPASAKHCLKYVLTHEIGHVLGLDHPGPSGELMSFDENSSIHSLQPGDIAGIVSLYGARTSAPLLAMSSHKPIAR